MTLTHEDDYYTGFRNGDEKAFEYVYTRYYGPLSHHGRQIIRDEFAVNCIVNEAFLKGWKWREKMESMRHIYCFIRQEVNWKSFAYLSNASNRFHRQLVGDGVVERYSDYFYDCQAEDANFFDEEKLKVIEEALPYLPANRRTIMTLYFKHGLSYKKIARRFGTSNQTISAEVQKSLESLKKIVQAEKKLNIKTLSKTETGERYCENMEPEMQMIFRLRYEQKHSFATIAQKMNITQGYVQQQYVMAHRKLRQLYHR